MKKTLLTLFTTIAVCGMSYSQVYAQIDVSVFENKADYDVDMDDFDDTGEISFVGGDNMPSGTVIGNPDGDSGYISGELDMISLYCSMVRAFVRLFIFYQFPSSFPVLQYNY